MSTRSEISQGSGLSVNDAAQGDAAQPSLAGLVITHENLDTVARFARACAAEAAPPQIVAPSNLHLNDLTQQCHEKPGRGLQGDGVRESQRRRHGYGFTPRGPTPPPRAGEDSQRLRVKWDGTSQEEPLTMARLSRKQARQSLRCSRWRLRRLTRKGVIAAHGNQLLDVPSVSESVLRKDPHIVGTSSATTGLVRCSTASGYDAVLGRVIDDAHPQITEMQRVSDRRVPRG